MLHLFSDQLKISINLRGAELCSVKNRNGLEFIWQASGDVWARYAPVLFPIVGKLRAGIFIFDNASYSLSQHGFARDREFAPIEKDDTSCSFELRSDERSKTVYPFGFIFQIRYELRENTLVTSYKIFNPSDKLIFFSVGAHPGFNCPLFPEEKYEDYYLQFQSSVYTLTELHNGLRLEAKKKLILQDHKLFLSENLFDNDALVFENKQIDSISLCSTKSSHKISLDCKDWPYFGIWSKKACRDFICLEPWFGIADDEKSNQRLEQKDGIIRLEPKKEFNCSFSITFD